MNTIIMGMEKPQDCASSNSFAIHSDVKKILDARMHSNPSWCHGTIVSNAILMEMH